MKRRVTSTHGALLYDGDCAFCARLAKYAMQMRIKADVVSMQSADLDVLGVDSVRAQIEVPFVHVNGDVDYGCRAIASALMSAPSPWNVLGRALTFAPMDWFSAYAYRFVARHRHQLPGGSPRCRIEDSSRT